MTHVRYELEGDVAVVTMDDGKANALSPPMIAQLGEALDRATSEAKAVLLTGREGKLCAGFDLKILMQGGQAAKDLFVTGGQLLLRIFEHPQPVVVASPGHAIAGGALLLGVGDLRIGADGPFKIGLNEVEIGLPLPIFAHEIARARISARHLDRATLLATVYAPREAAEVGWLDEVVALDALHARALAEAKRLAGLNAHAFAFSKRSMRGELADRLREVTEANLVEILTSTGR